VNGSRPPKRLSTFSPAFVSKRSTTASVYWPTYCRAWARTTAPLGLLQISPLIKPKCARRCYPILLSSVTRPAHRQAPSSPSSRVRAYPLEDVFRRPAADFDGGAQSCHAASASAHRSSPRSADSSRLAKDRVRGLRKSHRFVPPSIEEIIHGTFDSQEVCFALKSAFVVGKPVVVPRASSLQVGSSPKKTRNKIASAFPGRSPHIPLHNFVDLTWAASIQNSLWLAGLLRK
jgi:hypothetical protein